MSAAHHLHISILAVGPRAWQKRWWCQGQRVLSDASLQPPIDRAVQIYRAEYWSKQLGVKHTMPMLSMSLLMIAGISLASMAAAHPKRILALLANPPALSALISETQ